MQTKRVAETQHTSRVQNPFSSAQPKSNATMDTRIPLLILLTCILATQMNLSMSIQPSCKKKNTEDWGSCPLDSNYKDPIQVGESIVVLCGDPTNSYPCTIYTQVPEGGLYFCSEYRDKSCCDKKDATGIEKAVNELMKPECPDCYHFLKQWKCAECHPQAGINRRQRSGKRYHRMDDIYIDMQIDGWIDTGRQQDSYLCYYLTSLLSTRFLLCGREGFHSILRGLLPQDIRHV